MEHKPFPCAEDFLARKRIAVLLVNLGTPDAPQKGAVRRYLKEFLSDRRVVEAPRLLWWFVLRCFILPFRPAKVARLYQQIWQQDSPIRTLSAELAEGIQQQFTPGTAPDTEVRVMSAMTYGNPALLSSMDALCQEGFDRFLVLPIYPQYSATTTAPVSDLLAKWSMQQREIPEIRLIKDYWQEESYLCALANSVLAHQKEKGVPDRLLFSFHGIPQEYEQKGDCYGERCRKTALKVAEKLGLNQEQWKITFQSRFGPKQWLQPYTDETLEQWGQEGVEHVQVICPGFAIDCLETLEEIDGENREVFLQAGGKEFSYIPALNASDEHVSMLTGLVKKQIQGW